MYKMIAIDLDGTLLTDELMIPHDTVALPSEIKKALTIY